MNLNNLTDKIESYNKSIQSIEIKRQEWNLNVRQLIYDTLNKITTQYPLDWCVAIVEIRKNSESVVLSFNSKPSGIIESTKNEAKSFMSYGGKLCFQQCHNGDILIILKYPYVEDVAYPNLESKLLKQVIPSNINEELIINQVSHFLDEITFWQTCVDNQIGFAHNKKNG